jgi:hypothetical protein
VDDGGDTEIQDREGDLIARFAAWDKAMDAHWGAWRDEAKLCFGFVAGNGQWKDADVDKLTEIDRIAPVFNRVGPIIDAVSGAEIMDRQQVQYFPREVGDSGVNELLTKAADWVRDRCDADQEETEAFRDAFICGMGWTDTRMDYDEEPEGQIIVERVDPMEMGLDPTSRKANGIGARYIRRDKRMARETFEEEWPDFAAGGRRSFDLGSVIVDPRNRYRGDNDEDGDDAENEVWVSEYQWFENHTVAVVEDPEDKELVELKLEAFEELQEKARASFGIELQHVKQTRRVYYRAFVAGGRILNFDEEANEAEVLALGEFTYKLITGKRDRNKGIWYGLARPMIDPQRWANQFMSQLLAILAASAKGGLLLEADAVEDIRQFEASYAKPGANTYVKPGRMSGVIPKPATSYPSGLERLIGLSNEAIRDTTGVNPEMLGLVDREQAGVLEHQRKQAAYGILAAFFDAFRRYRREHGRLLLKFMKFLPEGYLIRIVGDDGLAKYVPFVKQDETAKFDVIVDEAPAGPNQKAATFGVIMQLMPYLKDADLPPQFWGEVAKYTPLPESLTQAMSQAILAPDPPDPMAERAKAADVAGREAKAQKDAAGAEKDAATAAETRTRTAADQAALADSAALQAAMGVRFPPDQTSFGEPQ